MDPSKPSANLVAPATSMHNQPTCGTPDSGAPHTTSFCGRKLPTSGAIIHLALLGCMIFFIVRYDRCEHRYRSSGIDFYHYWIVNRLASDAGHSAPRSDAGSPTSSPSIYPLERRQQLGAALAQEFQGSLDSQLVEVSAARTTLDLSGTPFFYSIIGNVGLITSFSYSYDLFFYMQVFLRLLSLLILCRLCRCSFLETFFLVAALTFWFEPHRSDVRVGNVNSIQLAGIVALALLRRSPFSTGLLGSLLVLFKPNLWTVGVWWPLTVAYRCSRSDRVRVICGLIIGGTVAGLYSCWFWGDHTIWVQWIQEAYRAGRLSYPLAEHNVSVAALVSWLTPQGSLPVTSIVATILSVGYGYTVRQLPVATDPNGGDQEGLLPEQEVALLGICVAGSIVASQLVWLHYGNLLLPLIVSATACSRQSRLWRWLVGASIGAVGYAATLLQVLHATRSPSIDAYFSLLFIGGTGALFLSTTLHLARIRVRPTASVGAA